MFGKSITVFTFASVFSLNISRLLFNLQN